MSFKEEMMELENKVFQEDYIIKTGTLPILFTAPHTMQQVREDGSIKLKEPYTKAIALYFNKHFHVSCIVKIRDTGLDSNRDNQDDFKKELMKFVKENKVKLVIDLHGASKERDFDVEFGTMNHLTTDYSTLKEFEEAFLENGIFNVAHNDPFKGGAITQYLYSQKDVDVIQLEINQKYRDLNQLEYLEKLCMALEKFILQYSKYQNLEK